MLRSAVAAAILFAAPFAHGGDKATDFTLRDIDGQSVTLSEFEGKVVVLSFWATWCGPCKEEMPHLQKMYDAKKDEGFEILSINCDESKLRFERTVDELGLTWRHCFEGKGLAGSVPRAWSVRALPDGALIDHTGRVRYLRPWSWDLRLAVQDLLARRDKAS